MVELNCNTLADFRYRNGQYFSVINFQIFVNCWIERSMRYSFFIDLERSQHKLSSDYSLNMCFSRRFPYIDGPSFSPYKPLQMSVFESSATCSFSFLRNCTHILTRTLGEKFKDMFLVKIESKGTSLMKVVDE